MGRTTEAEFSILAEPGTDIWRKPPTTNVWNGPAKPHQTDPIPLKSFKSAVVSFSAHWVEQYDQAGLLFEFQPQGEAPASPPARWIKTGLEFYEGIPQLSTVACDRWADWSVAPLPAAGVGKPVKILVEKEGTGASIWVYYVGEDGKKLPLREVCWVFADEYANKPSTLAVSAFASRPESVTTKESLDITFHEFTVEWE